MKSVVVTFKAADQARSTLAAVLADVAEVTYLTDVSDDRRAAVLEGADAVMSRNTARELAASEYELLAGGSLVQFMSAGVDFIPLQDLPPGLPVASNAGAYSQPMAEHGLAMTLAAAKGLFREHRKMEQGEFNQFVTNRTLEGATLGILGFGGIGKAAARLFRCLGAKVHAVNRSGATDEPVDFVGTSTDLPEVLAAADVLLITLPLTEATTGLIGAEQLALMKRNAILVNLARGEIIDEAALYRHLQDHPEFTACIDAWWVEPVRHGEFRMDHPFLALPNVIASPHNSASVPGIGARAVRLAAENVRRAIAGERPRNILGPDDMPPRETPRT